MNNLIKECDNATKNFDNFIKKGNKFIYGEDLLDEFTNNFIPLDEKEESEEEISNYIEQREQVYFTNGEKSIKNNFIEIPEINFNKIEKKKIFKVLYPDYSLYNTKYNQDVSSFKKRIRSSNPRKRRELQDNIRKRIKRYFFNQIILNDINEELKKSGNFNYFEKFPSDFVSDVTKKRNVVLMDMTLMQLMKNKEFYKEKYLENYQHNLKILNSLKEGMTPNLEKILNTKYKDLFNEFFNSDKYTNFLNQLIEDKESVIYLNRVMYISESWNYFFSK